MRSGGRWGATDSGSSGPPRAPSQKGKGSEEIASTEDVSASRAPGRKAPGTNCLPCPLAGLHLLLVIRLSSIRLLRPGHRFVVCPERLIMMLSSSFPSLNHR